MDRRSLLLGLGAVLAAPAIVRADSLMKLWVPLKPKLTIHLDISGRFYDQTGIVVGTYSNRPDGMVGFDITRLAEYHRGVVSNATMFDIMVHEDVRPYWPRPTA